MSTYVSGNSHHTENHHVLAGKDDDDDAEAEAEEDEGADTSFRSHEDEDDVDDGIDAFLKSDEEDLGSDEDDVPPEVEEEDEVEEEAFKGRTNRRASMDERGRRVREATKATTKNEE